MTQSEVKELHRLPNYAFSLIGQDKGIVKKISPTHSDKSLLLGMNPLGIHAVIILNPFLPSNLRTDAAIIQKVKELESLIPWTASLSPFALDTLDGHNWQPSLILGSTGDINGPEFSNHSRIRVGLYKHEKARPPASWLNPVRAEENDSSLYALALYSEVGPELQQQLELQSLPLADIASVKQSAAYQAIVDALQRSVLRIMYNLLQEMGLEIPATYDKSSVYWQNPNFDPPLLAKSQMVIAQLHNSADRDSDGTIITYNGAIPLNTAATKHSSNNGKVVTMLGPQQGFVMMDISADVEKRGTAIPVGPPPQKTQSIAADIASLSEPRKQLNKEELAFIGHCLTLTGSTRREGEDENPKLFTPLMVYQKHSFSSPPPPPQ